MDTIILFDVETMLQHMPEEERLECFLEAFLEALCDLPWEVRGIFLVSKSQHLEFSLDRYKEQEVDLNFKNILKDRYTLTIKAPGRGTIKLNSIDQSDECNKLLMELYRIAQLKAIVGMVKK